MADVALYLNLLLFVSFPVVFRDRWKLSIAVIAIWTTALTIFFYIAISMLAGKSPRMEFFGTLLPFWLLAPGTLALCVIAYRWRERVVALAAIVVGVILISYVRSFGVYNSWFWGVNTDFVNLVYSRTFVTPFVPCVLLPVAILLKHNPAWFKDALIVRITDLRKDIKVIVGAAIALAVVAMAADLLMEGSLVLRIYPDLGCFLRASAAALVGWILIDHVISFVLVPHVVRVASSGTRATVEEALLYGAVFAGLHYYFNLPYILSTFLEGAIFGYLLIKTGRPIYGIILSAMYTIMFGT